VSIQDKLIAWGRGLAINSPPNDLPKQTTFARFMAKGAISLPPLCDEEQQRIDRVVSDMKLVKPEHYEVICYAYITGLRDYQIRRKVKHRTEWVERTRLSAEGYLEAKLEDLG
jgi:hypothetical protein